MGIEFDSKLKFKGHITNVAKRIVNTKSASWRFTRGVRSSDLTRRLHDIYINPIVEYGSNVWGSSMLLSDNRLEAIQRNTTRVPINTPYRSDQQGYMSFEKRLHKLQMLSYKHRRIIAQIIFVIKTLRGEADSQLKSLYESARNYNPRNLRNANIFDLSKITGSRNTPIYTALRQINNLRHYIDLSRTTQAIRKTMTKYFLDTYQYN